MNRGEMLWSSKLKIFHIPHLVKLEVRLPKDELCQFAVTCWNSANCKNHRLRSKMSLLGESYRGIVITLTDCHIDTISNENIIINNAVKFYYINK